MGALDAHESDKKTHMQIHKIHWAIAVVLAACGPSQPPVQGPPTGDSAKGVPERKAFAQEACEAQGGSVTADIGDGATRRPDYLCPSGKPPLGNIAPPAGGPIPVEGAVCCPR
jgi:hypothetical protein